MSSPLVFIAASVWSSAVKSHILVAIDQKEGIIDHALVRSYIHFILSQKFLGLFSRYPPDNQRCPLVDKCQTWPFVLELHVNLLCRLPLRAPRSFCEVPMEIAVCFRTYVWRHIPYYLLLQNILLAIFMLSTHITNIIKDLSQCNEIFGQGIGILITG